MKKIFFIWLLCIPFFVNSQIVYFPFSCSFGCGYLVSDSMNFEQSSNLLSFDNDSLWQIGIPQKNIFNEAWSLPNALITDTINAYPDSVNTAFSLKIFPYLMGDLFIAFTHKVDVGEGDSCIVEFSTDGNSWLSMIELFGEPFSFEHPFPIFFDTDLQTGLSYPEIFNGFDTVRNLFYSDTAFDWTQTVIWIDWVIIVKNNILFDKFTDSLYVRFRFVSDENPDNKEGWMLDNFCIGNYWYKGTNIHETNYCNFVSTFPNPADFQTSWLYENFVYPLKIAIYDFDGKLVKNENLTSNTLKVDYLPEGQYFIHFYDAAGRNGYSKLQILR